MSAFIFSRFYSYFINSQSGKIPSFPLDGDIMITAEAPSSSVTRRGPGSPRGGGPWPTCTRWAGSQRRQSTTSGTGSWTRDGSTIRTFRQAGCTNCTITRSRYVSISFLLSDHYLNFQFRESIQTSSTSCLQGAQSSGPRSK